MLFGLGIGLAVALFVYLRVDRPPATIAATASQPAVLTAPEEPAAPSAAAATRAADDQTTDASDRADDVSAAELVFYEQLRNSEVVIPESVQADAAAAAAQEYVIQAGSFPALAGADRMKANLALIGIDSHIERAIIGSDIYHRVMIGPLQGRADINRVIRRLREARIDPLPPRPVAN